MSFDTDTAKLIQKLEKQSLELDQELSTIKEKQIQLENEKKNYEQLQKEEKIRQNNLLRNFEEDQKKQHQMYLEKAQDLIKELDELKKSASFKEHELAKLKKDVKDTFFQKRVFQKESEKEIQVGDTVKVLAYQRNGIVNKELKNDQFEIVMGALTLTVKKDEIEFHSRETIDEFNQNKTSITSPVKEVKVELDLHGKRYEEAMQELDKFVDNCLLNNLEFAYIVHGIGTGALKKGVEKYAKENSHIKSYRRGNEGEGGLGVTVIQFK